MHVISVIIPVLQGKEASASKGGDNCMTNQSMQISNCTVLQVQQKNFDLRVQQYAFLSITQWGPLQVKWAAVKDSY